MNKLHPFDAVRAISYWFVTSILLILSATTNASILTFDGFSGEIPDDYGDRITTTADSVTGYEYGMGNGFTPNITVGYFPDPVASGGQPFGRFPSGYGDLVNALGHGNYNVPGEVVLTPDAGFQVMLNSFDIAGWTTGTYVSQIRVLNQSDTILFDSGVIDINSSSTPRHLTFPSESIVSSEPLRIEIHDLGNLGLDNVNFDQAVVPIPEAVWLFGSGLLGLVGIARRNHAA